MGMIHGVQEDDGDDDHDIVQPEAGVRETGPGEDWDTTPVHYGETIGLCCTICTYIMVILLLLRHVNNGELLHVRGNRSHLSYCIVDPNLMALHGPELDPNLVALYGA
jgi:hypothetical protein